MRDHRRFAVCPGCRRKVTVFPLRGRDHLVHHGPAGTTREGEVCAASGWLVEDEDRLAVCARSDCRRSVPSKRARFCGKRCSDVEGLRRRRLQVERREKDRAVAARYYAEHREEVVVRMRGYRAHKVLTRSTPDPIMNT